MMEAEAAPVAVPETAEAPLPASPATPRGRTPRGARFAGAAQEPVEPRAQPMDEDARRATAETVQTLVRLRREGRSGEAHAVLVEAAYWPATRFPLLAAELHRAGLDADWATLLWEAASLPADRLVGAADALVAAGRTADGAHMLRQGVARPAPEIGTAVLSLADEGRRREIQALLDAYVRVRTPEEAARSVEADPGRLVPLLLEAAKGSRRSATGTWCTPSGWPVSPPEPPGKAFLSQASRGSPDQPLTHRGAKRDRLSGLTPMVLARLSRGLTFKPLQPLSTGVEAL